MPSLAIDRDFLREFAKLDKPVQERVTETFSKFEHATHTGHHLEKVKNARDDRFRTIRVNQFWRGVVLAPDSGNTYTLLKVLPHDDAYSWARRRVASVNTATGRIEIRDVEAIENTMPALSGMAEATPARLFEHVSDADLRRLGIDDQTLAFARVLTDPAQLDVSRALLAAPQWDVLAGLVAGLSPEEVWAEFGDIAVSTEFDPDDLGAAVARTAERMVLVDGPDELLAVFRNPFVLWPIYLHPIQRKTVDAHYGGPARVTGGPGTGKTVVALHRAHHLARAGEGNVLLTTFTSTLTSSLSAGLALLIEDDDVRGQIDVKNVDQVAHQIFRHHHGFPRMLDTDDEQAIWREIIAHQELPFSEPFLREEWRQVVLAHDIAGLDEYLGCDRTGRGRRLGTRQRAQVWTAIDTFQKRLRASNHWTHETVCVEATRLALQNGAMLYRHAVVDEAQDLSALQWRLLRAIVPEAENDLFLAGDTHQRIYSHVVSLRETGIHVTGRSSRLTLNYRTTAEILAWSLGLLRSEHIDDMDGGLESLTGCRSETHGLPPEPVGFRTEQAELDGLVHTIRTWLDADVAANEIGVTARTNSLASAAVATLRSQSITAETLSGGHASEEGVTVGSMHRMKGLEFRCIAVIGLSETIMPPAGVITPAGEDDSAHRQDLQRERCLLFVACTRAREYLAVSWHGARSPLLVLPG